MATLSQIESWINSGLSKDQINKKMAYVRAKGNIRKPRRTRRASTRYTRRRRTTSRRRTRTRKSTAGTYRELTPSAKFALAQLDPFEERCIGAKVPDSNTMPSLAHGDVDQIPLPPPTAANNLVAIAFNPSYVSARIVATQSSSTAVVWDGSFNTRRNFTKMAANIEAYRPVAHAIRLSCGLSPTATTGFVHMGICVENRINNDSTANIPNYPVNVDQMTGLAHYRRITLASLTQSPITALNKWIDDAGFSYDAFQTAYSFQGSSGVISTQSNNLQQHWGTLIVMVEGAPTGSNVLNIEHLLLSELLPQKDGFIIGTQAAPNSPGTMSTVSSMVGDTPFTHTEAEQESYIQRGLDAVQQGAAVAGEQVFQNVAVPLLQRVGANAVGLATNLAIGAIVGRGGLPGVNSNPNRLAIGG